jgi:glycosyltransferase involved in cell wall biosynthesis
MDEAMDTTGKPLIQLGIKAVFLRWGAPEGSHRTAFMSEQLGTDVQYIYITSRRGKFIAPIKYFFQTLMTFAFLVWHRYQLVFVQDPPIFAVLPVYLYSLFSKTRFIIDSHTNALQAPFWKWTLPLHRFLERRAITTIVTNDCLREMVEGWGAHSFTLEDPPAQFHIPKPMTLPDGTLNVVMVSMADYDEPSQEVLEVARELQDVDFYITGNFARSRYHQGVVESAPQNVHFTGYLWEGYFALLDAADVILCLTTEDNTFLSGANEALWLGKPLITSDWPILQRYFSKGAVHVDNTAESICRAIITMRDDLPMFEAGIRTLQEERRREWQQKAEALIRLIQQAMS